MQHTLVYFPDYAHANPYQKLLYACLDGDFHVEAGTIGDALARLRGGDHARRTIFHLHWEDKVYRDLASPDEATRACQTFLDQLETFVDEGGLFLWTIHNRAPHDAKFMELYLPLCEKLALLAHQIHLHSYAAVAELERERRLDRRKIVVIPHGNYVRLYRRPRPAEDETERVGRGRRFLLFGRLGRYKGGDRLVRAFAALGDRHAELVIAGKQIDPIDLEDLPASISGRITVEDRFLADEEIARLIAETDFMVAPYAASLTSGTLLLAMSLGQPVIAPRLPTITELVVDGENGLLFEPGCTETLTLALARACVMDDAARAAMAAQAQATALRYDWQMIGNLLSGVLHRLVARAPVRRLPGARPAALAAAGE